MVRLGNPSRRWIIEIALGAVGMLVLSPVPVGFILFSLVALSVKHHRIPTWKDFRSETASRWEQTKKLFGR